MRYLLPLVGLALFLVLPIAVQPAETPTFDVKYGAVNLGSWDHYTAGHSKTGLYDGSSFDGSTGKGYPTVTLTRPASEADGKDLFATLKPPNEPLVIRAHKGRVTVSTIACPKAMPDNFGIEGKTETLTFACTVVAVSPTKSRPKPKP